MTVRQITVTYSSNPSKKVSSIRPHQTIVDSGDMMPHCILGVRIKISSNHDHLSHTPVKIDATGPRSILS